MCNPSRYERRLRPGPRRASRVTGRPMVDACAAIAAHRWRLRLFLRGRERRRVARFRGDVAALSGRVPDLLRPWTRPTPRPGVGQPERRFQLPLPRRFAESQRPGGAGRARVRRSAGFLRRRVRIDGQDRLSDGERSAGNLFCGLRAARPPSAQPSKPASCIRDSRDERATRIPSFCSARRTTGSARDSTIRRTTMAVVRMRSTARLDAAHRLFDHVQAVAHVGALWTDARRRLRRVDRYRVRRTRRACSSTSIASTSR